MRASSRSIGVPDSVEVIVGLGVASGAPGPVHLPGTRLKVTDDEYAAFSRRRVASLASPENVAAIDDAIAKRLPIAGYVVTEDAVVDVTDPAQVARRASDARSRQRPQSTLTTSRKRGFHPGTARQKTDWSVSSCRLTSVYGGGCC
jgi:hypothetical protein